MKNKIISAIHSRLMQNILSGLFIFLGSIIVCNPLFSQEKITANFFYQKADSIASTFTSNPIIQQIISEGVDTSGKAMFWNYIFLQDSMSIVPRIHVRLGVESVSCDTSQLPPNGYAIMDPGWIDSDSALAVAEKNGGTEFRITHEVVTISADLCKFSASPITTWLIEYDNFFYIYIDALTGKVLYNSGVSSPKSDYHFQMLQNYPNPFNASTIIHFSIDKPGFVTLKVFDMIGRLVDVLLESFYEVGDCEINWSPKGLPSGVYLCKLETRGVVLTKKLLYSK